MRALTITMLAVAVSLSLVGSALAVVFDEFIPVPEPGTMALLLTGLGVGAAAFFRRRK